ncbi:hypothetical protein [Streptosporangium carneum]|uniref:Uncharacterized protein n=1 Tax=Streptosporangium carneum TaxID=47481 RepID=A0A9W6MHL7_9ACTN|nr:hypothetical protein [Streptosporangium carneum]GLK14158.1 hypothetical protein GCM10017600_75700 [Streptosporangium carneum]
MATRWLVIAAAVAWPSEESSGDRSLSWKAAHAVDMLRATDGTIASIHGVIAITTASAAPTA